MMFRLMRFAWGVSRILVPPTGASAPARISARRGTSRDGFFPKTSFPGLIFFRTTFVFVRRSWFLVFLVFFREFLAFFRDFFIILWRFWTKSPKTRKNRPNNTKIRSKSPKITLYLCKLLQNQFVAVLCDFRVF